MNILIYGANGWIGKQFISVINEYNIRFIKGLSRVDDKLNLLQEIEKINPTHIVSFVGRTHGKINNIKYPTIDYLEQPGKLYEN